MSSLWPYMRSPYSCAVHKYVCVYVCIERELLKLGGVLHCNSKGNMGPHRFSKTCFCSLSM